VQEVEDNLALLTDRACEVLQLIAEGKTNKDVRATLDDLLKVVDGVEEVVVVAGAWAPSSRRNRGRWARLAFSRDT